MEKLQTRKTNKIKYGQKSSHFGGGKKIQNTQTPSTEVEENDVFIVENAESEEKEPRM